MQGATGSHPSVAHVPARIGLLGNPSDGFGGRVIAATIADFAASVRAEPSDRWAVVDAGGNTHSFDQSAEVATIARTLDRGAELLAAAIAVLTAHAGVAATTPLRLSFESTIPRQVGLSGSSAIVIAALRAVDRCSPGPVLGPLQLAALALRAETEVLGWAAGPQDRVVQAVGGLLDMDFASGPHPDRWQPDRFQNLDPAGLPPLVLAWDPTPGASSNLVHTDVRGRFEAGEPEVVATLAAFAELAVEGREAFDRGAATSVWPDLLDRAFDLRCRFWQLTELDRRLVELARHHGIGATLAGSGGAIVGAAREPQAIERFLADARSTGACAIRPTVAAARP